MSDDKSICTIFYNTHKYIYNVLYTIYFLLLGVLFLSEYKLNRSFVDPNDPSASGMQGQPETLADMTDGQAEERFFQLVILCLLFLCSTH